MELDKDLMVRPAKAAHADWMVGRIDEEGLQGMVIDEDNGIHTCFMPYSDAR